MPGKESALRMRGHSCSFEHLTTTKEDSVHNGAEDTILAANEKRFSMISHELQQMTQGHLELPSISWKTIFMRHVTLFQRELDYMITKIPSNFLTLEFAKNHYLTLQCTKEKSYGPLSETAIKARNALSFNNEKETCPSP